jgi:hypothetical protein
MAAPSAWAFPDGARTRILNGTWDFDTDSFKMALFTSGTNLGSATTTFAGVTSEVGTTNTGYTAGGMAVTLSLSGTTTVKVDIGTDPVWTAGTANLTARYAAIYEVGGDVVCYSLLDSAPADVTATSGNTFTVAANATNGVFGLA